MSNPLKRIKEYIDLKGIKISTFEKLAGLSNGAFGGQLKKNKTIGVDKLENILRAFPDLNAHWVLTGTGKMLKEERPRGSDQDQPTDLSVLLENHQKTVIALNAAIVAQQRTIDVLEQLVIHRT